MSISSSRWSERVETLTKGQLQLIQSALRDSRYLSSPVPGKKIYWREVVSEVANYTELSLLPPTEHPSSGDQDHLISMGAQVKHLKIIAEHFRQFAEGDPAKPGKIRKIAELPYIIEYLTHKEIAQLDETLLEATEITLEPIRSLSFFVEMANDDKKKCTDRLLGKIFVGHNFDRSKIVSIETGSSGTDGALSVSITWYAKGLLPTYIWHGFLIFFSDERALTISKDHRTRHACALDLHVSNDEDPFILLVGHGDYALNSALSKDEIQSSLNHEKDQALKKHPLFKYLTQKFLKNLVILDSNRKIEYYKNISGSTPSGEKIGLFGDVHASRIMDLFEVISSGDLQGFSVCVESASDINSRDGETDGTILHYIAAYGLRDHLRIAIKREDLDYLARDRFGRLASELAASTHIDPLITRFLLTKEMAAGSAAGVLPLSHVNHPLLDP